MKNKGFTVVEFIVSFCLATTISFLLFQIILGFKDLYIKGNIETSFEIKKSNMLKLINNDLFNKNVIRIEYCNDTTDCLQFIFSDETVKELKVDNNTIYYGDYKFKPIDGTIIGNGNSKIIVTKDTPQFNEGVSGVLYNEVLKVEIPIKNKLSESSFDIKFIYLYDNSVVKSL